MLYKRMYRCRASGKRVYKESLSNVQFLKGLNLRTFILNLNCFSLNRCMIKVKFIKVGFGAVLDKRGIKH